MQLKEKAKDARQKQKDSEEQYKKQQMNLCGEFLEHALKQWFNPNWLINRLGYFLPPPYPFTDLFWRLASFILA